MKIRQYRCTLLADVILNVKAATEGNNSTLDFIPGNNFLGIVAKQYPKFSKEEQMEIFHSGKVRFGDAHPVVYQHEDIRSVRTPFSLFHPKMKNATDECYVHHYYHEDKEHPLQLKQCRTGFYAFDEQKGFPAEVKRSFAIKSAYDRERRRAKDEDMYGYESLDAGLSFLFEVECESDDVAEKISKYLVGTHRIGRSRSAQYGLVEIETASFRHPKGSTAPISIDGQSYVVVYAESRLIFLDDNGICTFQPTPEQLGISDENAEIDWAKSQVRTFQYAPWNSTRKCRDTDRCGVEKGSVFVVKVSSALPTESQCIGSYKNEGFGKVIYNPEFLQVETGKNGVPRFKLQKPKEINNEKTAVISSEKPLLKFLRTRRDTEIADSEIMQRVNDFVEKNKKTFTEDKFASQWGNIRSIAMRETNSGELSVALFGENIFKPEEKKDETDGYLTHGTAKDKWSERGRLKLLRQFAENNKQHLRKAIVNLASEMAKN